MISTWIRDLLFLFIFTFLCFYYDCTRNILWLRDLNNETATVRFFFVVSVVIWILLLSFWEYRILWQKVRSMFRKQIFSQPSFQSLFDYSRKHFREIIHSFILLSASLSIVSFPLFIPFLILSCFLWMILSRYGF